MGLQTKSSSRSCGRLLNLPDHNHNHNDVNENDGNHDSNQIGNPFRNQISNRTENKTTNRVRPNLNLKLNAGSDSEKGAEQPNVIWKPRWLQSFVLGTFAVFFLLMVAALILMLRYSNIHTGLVETHANTAYLWRIGPTAVLTLLTIFWARVNLQAMRYMPWIALRQKQPFGKDGFGLDYTSMWSGVVLIQSLQNKHYLVFLTTVVSVILKLQIIMAPGLYSLVATGIPKNTTVEVFDSFNVNYLAGNTLETGAYYDARAVHDLDMFYPFGVSKLAAYQTFRQTGGPTRGSSSNPVTALVDGFFSDIQCLKLQTHSVTDTRYGEDENGDVVTTVDVNLQFEGCQEVIPITNYDVPQPSIHSAHSWEIFGTVNETLAPQRPCPNLPQQNPQFLYWVGRFERSATNSSRMYIEEGAAVLCAPTAWLSKVKVVDDGINPQVTVMPGEEKTPVAVNTWKLLNNTIPPSYGGNFVSGTNESNTQGPVKADQMFWGQNPDLADTSLFTTDGLYDSVKNLTESLGPFLGHYFVRRKDNADAPGATSRDTDKLVVNYWICVIMTALFGVNTFIAFFVVVRYRRRTAVWHQDPASVLGNMIVFRDHPGLVESVLDSSIVDISSAWSRSNFNPTVLKAWARISCGLFTACLAAGLVYTLRRSESSDGFVDVNDEENWHLLWTSLPALVGLGVYCYVSSCDWAYRALATVFSLSTRPCGTKEIHDSLLDMLGVNAFGHSIRRKIWAVSFAQLLAIMCGFLTTVITILFSVETVPEQSMRRLSQQTWFGTQSGGGGDTTQYSVTRTTLGNLAQQYEANITYPQNTYDSLVFPALGGFEDIDHAANKSLRFTIAAAQPQASCSKLPDDQYSVSIQEAKLNSKKIYEATFYEPFTCSDTKQTRTNMTRTFKSTASASIVGEAYFGGVLGSPENFRDTIGPCNLRSQANFEDKEFFPTRTKTYIWGKLSVAQKGFEYLSVWKCNYTIAKVDTEVNMINVDGDFVVDVENPPKPDSATLGVWDPAINLPRESGQTPVGLIQDPYPDVEIQDSWAGEMDNEFKALLTATDRPIPLSALGSSTWDERILHQLTSKYEFLQAQLLNVEGRLGLYQDSISTKAPGSLPAVDAEVTDKGRRRLKQNVVVTYIVVAILLAVSIINLLTVIVGSRSHVLSMNTRGLAPKGFNSIESMVGLLRGSNAVEHLPAGTELLSEPELYGQMSNLNFQLGWFQRRDGMRIYTVGVLGDDGFEFKFSKQAFNSGLERVRQATYDTFASAYGGKKA
ncbi:hypothetical protein CkaCkLH20_09160 [Colletotrichum karsti]|uniref:Uncharacterized protein n=1 Tax=Colletotrichum karsti TaxID=1095194 RepID=A0A9P6LI88_9PEZI|nr:uncharacterized protein CkaCkLH20_09160 [Colletotrichum karsti]KAF9873347.1 hypothetical protein CkaCkLH20_09160 [Colletotrichum karsti]